MTHSVTKRDSVDRTKAHKDQWPTPAATILPGMAPKEASPLSVQPSCKQGPLCLSSDPFCLLKAETGTVALLLASQSTFRLRALFSPSTPSQPARLNSRQHSFGFIVQLWPESRPKLAGSVEDQHRPIQLHTTYLSSFWEPVTQT